MQILYAAYKRNKKNFGFLHFQFLLTDNLIYKNSIYVL